MTWEQTKKERIAAGLCALCGKYPISPHSESLCEACRGKQNAWSKVWAHQNRQQLTKIQKNRLDRLQKDGKCTRCGKARGDSGSELFCTQCLEQNRRYEHSRARKDYQKSRYHTRRTAGLCTKCGKPSQKSICDECKKKYYGKQ